MGTKKSIHPLILLLIPAISHAGDGTTRDPLADVESWSREIEGSLAVARRSGDSQRIECLERRATPMRVLLDVIREASSSIAGLGPQGDRELIDRERRKTAVAHAKAVELRSLASTCGAPTRSAGADGGTPVSLVTSEQPMIDPPGETIITETPDASPN